jgi:hypothetical protein
MAVRAARNTGLVVTVVIFVFLTLVGMGLAIMFYSRVAEAQTAANAAQTELRKFTTGATDIGAIEAAMREAQPPSPGVVAHLQAEVARLKRRLTGAETQAIALIERDLQSAGVNVAEGANALDYIRSLTKERDTALQQSSELDKQLADAGKRIEQLEAMKQRAERDAADQSQKLDAALSQLQQDLDALRQAQEQSLNTLQASIDKNQADSNQKLAEAENEAQRVKGQVAELQKRIDQMRGGRTVDTPQVPQPIRDVDGQIIAIPPSKNIVYVNLGRQDHLVLGMTFEVFDVNRGVEIDVGEGEERTLRRGKATIEVVKLQDRSSLCRIVRSSFGQPVQVGDVIANLVYDKQRSFKFYIFGDFNLDNIGEASLSDREMVINLIERWGGQVVKPEERQRRLASLPGGATEENLLPFDTDFLIVGQEPTVPDTPAEGAEPAEIARAARAQQQLDLYNRLRREANELGIPILNQNRFLALIGYYQR